MVMTVAQVDALIESAPDTEIALPAYTGAPGDLTYLKNYVISAVTARYGVDASIFNTATLESTSILRDFVHRAIYDHPQLAIYDDVATDPFSYQSDVGGLFREGGWYQCGEISWQLQNIYQSLGYKSSEFWTFNGEDGSGTANAYNDGHVRVDVYLEDYGKYVDQDATYNWLMVDQNDQPLSFHEAQVLNVTDPSNLHFEDTGIYTYYGLDGYHYEGLPSYFDAFYRSNYMDVVYGWMSDGVYSQQDRAPTLDWSSTHTVAQYGAYASASTAQQDVMALAEQGKSLLAITDALRDNHQVSGFRLISPSGNTVDGDYVTVQLTDASYVSINIATGNILNGSYDQIVDYLAGTGQNLNPGIDTTDFLDSAVFIQYDGTVISEWDLDPENPLVASIVAEEASRWPVVYTGDGGWIQNFTDAYDQPFTLMTEYYNSSGSLYYKETWYDNGDYSQTPYDWQNQYSWSNYEYKYDHTGQHISTIYHNDDGSTQVTNFDTMNQVWDHTDIYYNAAGYLVNEYTAYDDGGWVNYKFDYLGQAVWNDWQFRYNAQGQEVSELINYDNKGHVDIFYDYQGVNVWSNWQYRYDAGNKLVAELIRYDDGGHVDVVHDAANAYTWDNTQTRYNSAGNLAAILVRNDDHSYTQTTYDPLHTQVWTSASWYYNSIGQLTLNRYNLDDGGMQVINYDKANIYNWSDWQTTTNSAGQITREYVHYDDKHTTLTVYDPTNLQPYDHYTDTRDANGNLISHVVTPDHGTLIA